jgi:ribonucleoside-diphosphate reductase alpha chain
LTPVKIERGIGRHSAGMSTLFTDARSVDAWDARFRWRENGDLRDVVVDDTWRRVAQALIRSPHDHNSEALRYFDAFSSWQLLPDPAVLALAGTGGRIDASSPLCVALNVSAFVQPGTPEPRLDIDALRIQAGLAVKLLEDCNIASSQPVGSGYVCVIGFADALHQLGIPYCSDAASTLAKRTGAAIAEGTLAGNVRLAAERGATVGTSESQIVAWSARGTPSLLIQAAVQHGLRRETVTRIERQGSLALFANGATESVAPARGRASAASRFACSALCEQPRSRSSNEGDPTHPVLAELAIRAAFQPFIDEPIDLPVSVHREWSARHAERCRGFAARVGLPEPRFEPEAA